MAERDVARALVDAARAERLDSAPEQADAFVVRLSHWMNEGR